VAVMRPIMASRWIRRCPLSDYELGGPEGRSCGQELADPRPCVLLNRSVITPSLLAFSVEPVDLIPADSRGIHIQQPRDFWSLPAGGTIAAHDDQGVLRAADAVGKENCHPPWDSLPGGKLRISGLGEGKNQQLVFGWWGRLNHRLRNAPDISADTMPSLWPESFESRRQCRKWKTAAVGRLPTLWR
jgi:hypothetical protein